MIRYQAHAQSPFGEDEEMELAAELLATANEQELDHFLSNLMRRSSRGRRFGPQRMRALGGWMKGAFRRVFPRGGRFSRRWFGPDPDEQDGQDDQDGQFGELASGAGELLGLEMEGLSAEDQEFAAARQLVRLAGSAAAEVAANSDSQDPQAAAQQAMAQAARIHAPGLLKADDDKSHHPCGCGSNENCHCHSANTGRWVRRGNRIILHGL